MHYLTPQQVLFLHARLVDETGGLHGVRDLSMMESAVARPAASFDDRDLYVNVYAKAAALMESLINNHPFTDGNKRTGIASAALFLRINNMKLTARPDDLEEMTLLVAQGKLSVEGIAKWLRNNSTTL